jgi:nicotinate-nucleotide pyrophosphorylase
MHRLGERAQATEAPTGRLKSDPSFISVKSLRAVAETGVDVLSVGALTDSSRSLNVCLEVL